MKKTIQIIILGVIVAGISFYGGMRYGKSVQTGAILQGAGRGGNQIGFGMRRGGMQGGGFTAGEVIAKDDKSITIKLRDGGSKIVFFSSGTSVLKSVSGTSNDLAVGNQVTVVGNPNADGSISAESVQIRPVVQSTNK